MCKNPSLFPNNELMTMGFLKIQVMSASNRFYHVLQILPEVLLVLIDNFLSIFVSMSLMFLDRAVEFK